MVPPCCRKVIMTFEEVFFSLSNSFSVSALVFFLSHFPFLSPLAVGYPPLVCSWTGQPLKDWVFGRRIMLHKTTESSALYPQTADRLARECQHLFSAPRPSFFVFLSSVGHSIFFSVWTRDDGLHWARVRVLVRNTLGLTLLSGMIIFFEPTKMYD